MNDVSSVFSLFRLFLHFRCGSSLSFSVFLLLLFRHYEYSFKWLEKELSIEIKLSSHLNWIQKQNFLYFEISETTSKFENLIYSSREKMNLPELILDLWKLKWFRMSHYF